MDWVITIPKTVGWEDYQKELKAVQDYGSKMYYRVQYFPRGMATRDRIFVVWNNRIRGWMRLVGMEYKRGFVCSVTKRGWPEGNYLVRSGPFHEVDGPEMKGFRGIRKLEWE